MARGDGQELDITVPVDDPKKTEKQKAKEEQREEAARKGLPPFSEKKINGKDKPDDELSEDDLQLKNELEMLVERLKEPDSSLYRPALESLRTLIRTSTSSMTSVPKPLKFLRPHYPELKSLYQQWKQSSADKSLFAQILSVLAMTYSDNGQRETLQFRLEANKVTPNGNAEDPGLWGHEYMRHLASELGEEYDARSQEANNTDELLDLALQVVPFSLTHNAEADAVDLLLELEAIDKLPQFVDKDTYARVCLYMVSCVNLLVPPDDAMFLRTAHEIYHKHERYTEAMSLALRLNDKHLIRSDFEAPKNPIMRKQLAFMLARQHIPIEWLQDDDSPIADNELLDIMYNSHLSKYFVQFGKELNVFEPKSLEDIYKTHLETSRTGLGSSVDSARGNLASTFVNAFVNAGFGNDKLMVDAPEGNSWIYKNKDHGMLSAAASLGMSLLWNTETGLDQIDKYSYSSEEAIKAGAFLAYGIVHSGLRSELDEAMALLSEHIESKSIPLKVSAIVGLGLAYAGFCREDIAALLLPNIQDETTPMEVAAMSALSLGFVFAGSCHGEITPTILQSMMERDPAQLDDKWGRFMILGLALLFLGKQDESDATIETLKAIEHPISKQAQVLVDMCSYAGTGNVLKVQNMLHYCTERSAPESSDDQAQGEGNASGDGENNEDKKDKETNNDLFQAFAVIGIALVTMGEEVGAEMALRHLSHLMHYGEPTIRKTVPLALALLHPSNPSMPVLDTLSKYSHDSDLDVAINAILAMGLVGAGSNNARLAQMLRQLAGYYYKEPDCLFMVRVSQGLVHMGKGTIGINPYHTDRQLMSRTAVAGILALLTSMTDARSFVLDQSHWMLYFLSSAMYPRFLITLDENLEALPTSVRVGKAVDVVGQAGKPRTISGFQTHTTPVRVGTHERAELGTEEYLAYVHVLEGFSILLKNPGYVKEEDL
ncbi:probable RPN1 - 26S proteasome regulatory subunit [Melanopsichium pennsylvanicum]|uniref:26S proteasome regulatory subunit RPN1 n=2 Tax=Melanopsichium pennsylvanicum TaxID=63383 RepID=A0AAJ4XKI8_9BASI|nr:probable RPN1-26S proteasome regulatory subunit [Melanopsichium pennsylvanicum 4]SNX83793.1 probable RPN1 - 26S proteasome regulatory subunit [Melanopsichium pennsylvanicum]